MASHSPYSGASARQRRQDEQNRPLASALALGSQYVASIEESHERCAAFGLSRIERPDHAPLGRSDLSVSRERNQRLYSHAAPVMEMLHEQIVNSASMVVLCDATGTIIHSIGDDDFLARASKVALQPGVNWSEPAKGTNAIGTALVNETPTLVHADEHFMHANHFLTCSAAPILDPRGNVLGVLDVTGDHRAYHQHTMALVKMSARMIENHWLATEWQQGGQHEAQQQPLRLAPEVQVLFQAYRWPGNVRQLFNVLRTAAVMAAQGSAIQREHLCDDFLDDARSQAAQSAADAAASQAEAAQLASAAIAVAAASTAAAAELLQPRSLEEVEINAIRRTVGEVGGNISEASKRLGISRNTIYRKLRWNVSRP